MKKKITIYFGQMPNRLCAKLLAHRTHHRNIYNLYCRWRADKKKKKKFSCCEMYIIHVDLMMYTSCVKSMLWWAWGGGGFEQIPRSVHRSVLSVVQYYQSNVDSHTRITVLLVEQKNSKVFNTADTPSFTSRLRILNGSSKSSAFIGGKKYITPKR